MSFSVIIPARYGSTRLPAKPLAEIAGRPLISHVVDRARDSDARQVIVATDDERVAKALQGSACEVVMTSPDHESGSDRLAEVVALKGMVDDEIVVNVQGDEPTIPPRLINEVAAKLASSTQAVMATAAQAINSVQDFNDPNMVKVVMDQTGRALYFSRAPIPYPRNSEMPDNAWHHIGIYAYRAGFLKRYASLQPSDIERAESLEQLRVMDNGESIMVHCIDYDAGVGVDTQADLERAREIIQSQAW